MTNVVDIFKSIVEEVRNSYDPDGGEMPYYMYGHPLEIATILSEKDASSVYKYKKYPAICLFQDFDETHTAQNFSVSSLNIAIITETEPTYSAEDRYTNSFNDVLLPLFELLDAAIKKSKYLDVLPDSITYTKTDRLFWGRSNENIMNDYIDAVEISNLDLTFHKFC